MTTTLDDWQRREALLDRLLDLPEHEREAFIDTVALTDPHDAAALRDWMTGIDQSTGYLAPSASDHGIRHAGERIGRWRVLRLLGRGGMGEVWLGERADGLYARQVAIKFIRDDRPALRRSIESERRVLAGLHHPGIVPLIDAGATDEGHPYLVTDYIDGATLDAWLDREQPDISRRLDLFRQIAEALTHAHGQLVVHRDIKPANLLVDARGQAHLLDFGIASALAHEAATTQTTEAALTPEYAAPEIVVDNRASVRSDIYALGGLLHFLLSGRAPLSLRGLPLVALVARIRDEVPAILVRPALEPALRGLPARLLGDLAAIVGKALAKAPDERYASVEAMWRDIEAAQANRPIAARAPDPMDRARRALRRHRVPVAVAVLVSLSLLAGMAGTLWQARVARQERDRAEAAAMRAAEEARTATAVRDFLVGVFESANPERTLGQVPTVLDLVEAGVREAEATLADQPALQAELVGTLGDTYIGLGRYDLASALLRKALDRAESTPPGEPSVARKLVVRYARAVGATGGPYDDVRARLDRMLASTPPSSPDALALDASARAAYGGILHKTGEFDAAAAMLERATGEAREAGEAGQVALVDALHAQVQLAYAKGRRAEAIARLRDVIALLRQRPGGAVADTNVALLDLATLLGEDGHGDEAMSILRSVVDSNTSIYGRAHPATIASVVSLARALMRQSDFAQARILLEEMLALSRQQTGEDSETTALARTNLAALEYAMDDPWAAIALIGKVRDHTVAHHGARSPRALKMRQNLARLYLDAGDIERAEAELHALLEGLEAIDSGDHAEALALLGDAARERADPAGARALHQRALEVYAANGDKHSFDVQDHRIALAEDERDLGDLVAARGHAQAGLDGLRELDPQANAAMIDYARFVLAQLDVLEQRCPAEALAAFDAMLARTQARVSGTPASASAWKVARVELYRGVCRRVLDPADADVRAQVATAAKAVLDAPRADPNTKRLGTSNLRLSR